MKNIVTKIGDSRVIGFTKTHKKEIALVVCGGIAGAVIHKKLMPNDVRGTIDMMYKYRKGSKNTYGLYHEFGPGMITVKDLGTLGDEIIKMNNSPVTPDEIVTGGMVTIFTK